MKLSTCKDKTAVKSTPSPTAQIEAEEREEKELEKTAKMLRGDLVKLSTLLSKNGQLSLVLEQQNTMMETDFLHRLKAQTHYLTLSMLKRL